MSDIGDSFHKAYSTIVFRDLNYVVVGAIPLGLLVHFEQFYAPFVQSPALASVAFGFLSYIVGVALFHLGILLPCFPRIWIHNPNDKRVYETQQVEFQLRLFRIAAKYPDQMRSIERLIYIVHINGGIAIASLAGVILWLLYGTEGVLDRLVRAWNGYLPAPEGTGLIWPPILMALLVATSYVTNRSRAEILSKLVTELDSRNTFE